MKKFKTLFTLVLIMATAVNYAQSEGEEGKENSSQEIVTKTIRIKGANGEEKVITKEEVITKKSKIKLNPGDEGKTNQTAVYTDEEVAVQKSHSASNMGKYTMTTDEKGLIVMTFSDKPDKQAKVRKLSSTYYMVNLGDKDNSLGHFDSNKNFVVETFNTQMDQIVTTIYSAN